VSLLDKFITPTRGGSTSGSGGAGSSSLPPAPAPTITEVLGISSRNVEGFVRGEAVEDSRDLHRVLELPRRGRPDAEILIQEIVRRYGKPNPACSCKEKFHRRCADKPLFTQAWALTEISQCGGLLGPIAVGDGKTLLDLLAIFAAGVKSAVLLIPPQLKAQLIQVDWEFYSQHWYLPNLANGRWYDPKLPMLHVVAYSELSSAKNSDVLDRIRPDLIIADEAHLLRNSTAARTKRFKRYFSAYPGTKFCCWSGTLTTKSLKDYAHLSNLALKDGSPTPLHWPTVEEWAGALDPSDWPTGIGALKAFCKPGEYVRDGYRRRLEETPGVVSSPATMNCTASLVISKREISAPKAINDALAKLYNDWERPDGEEKLVSALEVHRCAKELSAGFYYHWIWPRGESLEVRKTWLAARRAWHSEMREKLKHSREFMDSPLLLAKAAIRWHEGFIHVEQDGRRVEVPPHQAHAPLPTWNSLCWPDWKALRGTAEPKTEGVWVDQFLAEDAAAWLAKPGIVWSEHDLFGRRVAEIARAPYFGPGADAAQALLAESGSRGIVASIRAHGTGKNLQAWQRNLVANLPSDAAIWEQLIGRTHRQGQLADEVTVEVYQHTPPVIEALSKARLYADYIQSTMGGRQKLLAAQFLFD